MSYSSHLITGFRDLLVNDVRIQQSVKTVKRGIFYPSASFPVLSIIPLNERVTKHLSGGQYYYKRSYSLQAYTKSVDIQQARKDSFNIVEQCKFVLQEYINDHNKDTGYNISFLDTTYQDYQDVADGIIALAFQGFEVFSIEQMPDARTREDINLDVKTDEIGQRLFELIQEGKRIAWGKLAKVNNIYYPVAPMISDVDFPAIAIVPVSDTKERYSQQRDLSINTIQVQIWTKLSDHEINLLFLLEILDDLRAFIFKTRTLNDKCWNMIFNGVDFQYHTNPDTLRAYLATITVQYHTYENSRR